MSYEKIKKSCLLFANDPRAIANLALGLKHGDYEGHARQIAATYIRAFGEADATIAQLRARLEWLEANAARVSALVDGGVIVVEYEGFSATEIEDAHRALAALNAAKEKA